MTKIRVAIIILTALVVGFGGLLASFYARGLRFNWKTFKFSPTGILVIKSDPEAAQVFINAELKTATNATVSLAPGTYDVAVKKEGYLSWYKRLTIEKEVVTEAFASLFRAVPSLTAYTFTGVQNPVISSDFTKIVYGVPAGKDSQAGKSGFWVMETLSLPLGFTRDPRRISDMDTTGASWEISPDGRQALVSTKSGVYLIDLGNFTPQSQLVNVASRQDEILATWHSEEKNRRAALISGLPAQMADVLTRKVSAVFFSPDETKVLYTASASAQLAQDLIKPLPGSSTQKQERKIESGQTYVYDIKEDRNFLIDNGETPLAIESITPGIITRRLTWFPTSKHLVLAQEGSITILDYDGTNRQVVYSGSYIAPYAFPFAQTGKLLILTNLGAGSSFPNLYSVSLR